MFAKHFLIDYILFSDLAKFQCCENKVSRYLLISSFYLQKRLGQLRGFLLWMNYMSQINQTPCS